MIKKGKWALLIAGLLMAALLVLGNRQVATRLFSESRWNAEKLPVGNLAVPTQRRIQWNGHSAFADSLYQSWKEDAAAEWGFEKKMELPRTLLAQLLANRNIAEVNRQILNLEPWGTPGSKWWGNPRGGYDFSATTFTTILYLFDERPEILYPEAKKRLVEILLNDEGEGYSDAVPGTFGRIIDSENHILMAQGSKYLKNRYLMLHGNRDARYDNELNGLEAGLLGKLKELSTMGLYEFNSVPYLGYTLAALLNLEAFGEVKIRNAARELLDYLSFSYALGSYQLNYYPPFRRRYERAKNSALSKDYQTIFMKTWLSYHPGIKKFAPVESGETHALIAACMPYRPADEVVDLLFNKSPGYFVKLGHGSDGSPEIYSAGPGYLLSAGGVNRGKWSNIVARPICLFLEEDAQELKELVHLKGKGKDFMQWNNTGVYKDFACTNGTLFVPEKYKPAATNAIWSVYAVNDSLSFANHSAPGVAILALFRNRKATELADQLMKLNPDPTQLRKKFHAPEGSILEYELNPPNDQWVITAVDGQPTDRDFGRWPLINGEYPVQKSTVSTTNTIEFN